MSKNIDRVETRARLPLRREPYWKRLAEGRYVGFRKLNAGTPGTWLAKLYDGERKYQRKPLGEFAELEERQRFDAAKRAAEEWFGHLDHGGSTQETTVKAACEAYAAKLRQEKSEAAALGAEDRFRRLVEEDPIARTELTKLRPQHVEAWRRRVLALGSRAYFNRNLVPLRAALRLAYDERKVASDFAWSKALRPLKLDTNEGRRTLYLAREQRQKLIEKASDEFRPLLIAWTHLPLRPGDLAKVRVEHLNQQQRVLLIPKGKTSSHVVPLPATAYAHLKDCAKSKLPGAWLIAMADGGQWTRGAWGEEIKRAAGAAKLPGKTVAYTIRHSTITDLVTSGLDIFSVAKVSGTSVAMIEKYYGHLQHDHARKALEKLSLI